MVLVGEVEGVDDEAHAILDAVEKAEVVQQRHEFVLLDGVRLVDVIFLEDRAHLCLARVCLCDVLRVVALAHGGARAAGRARGLGSAPHSRARVLPHAGAPARTRAPRVDRAGTRARTYVAAAAEREGVGRLASLAARSRARGSAPPAPAAPAPAVGRARPRPRPPQQSRPRPARARFCKMHQNALIFTRPPRILCETVFPVSVLGEPASVVMRAPPRPRANQRKPAVRRMPFDIY